MKRCFVLALVLGGCGGGSSLPAVDGGTVDAGQVDAGSPDAGPAPTAAFTLTGLPSPQMAGVSGTLTVTAVDATHATSVDYVGTVHFTSNDAAALLPADYTFTASEHGVHTFPVTLKTAATIAAVTATDTVTAAITGTLSPIAVTPAAAASALVTGFSSPQVAGTAGLLSVTLRDAFGNLATAYQGTLHFTSNDVQAVLPANYTFVGADQGSHSFSATLKTVTTTASITATDTTTTTLAGTQSPIVITAAEATSLLVSGFPSPNVAGTGGMVTVTVRDPFGNVSTGYRGTVHFSSNDPQAVLPPSYTFVAGDNGVHSFSTALKTVTTTASITATDTTAATLTGTQSPIAIIPAGAAQLVVSGFPSPSVAGTAGLVTVSARDAFANVATGYRGTIRVSSNDPQAVLPPSYTFVAGDNGVHSFSTRLITATTTALITASDTTATLTGTESPIVVVAAGADPGSSTLSCTPSRVLADDTQTVACAATFADSYGNRLAGAALTWSVACFDLIAGTSVACSGDTFTGPTSTTTDASGQGTNALHSNHPQLKFISATAGGVTKSATVVFMPVAGPRSIAAFGGLFNHATAVVATGLPSFGLVQLRSQGGPGNTAFLAYQSTGGAGVTGLSAGLTGPTSFWVTTNTNPSSITIYNPGSTGNVTSFTLDAGSSPVDVVAADTTNDNNSDLVVLGADDTIRYYTNSGTTAAAFTSAPITLATGLRPRGLAAGRVAGSNSMTVAIACEGADTVQLSQPFCFFSCGDLGTTITLPARAHPVAVKLLSVGGESHLLVAEAGLDQLQVFRVSQDPSTLAWTVTLLQTMSTGLTPTSISTGTLDLTGASVMAVAVGNELAGTVSAYLVGSTGLLTPLAVTSVGFQVSNVVFVPALESSCSDDVFVTGPDGFSNTFVVRFTSAQCPIF